MSLKVQRAREWLARKSRNPRNAYPMATVVYYGPTDRLASKVVAAVVRGETDESAPLERWLINTGDIRQDSAVLLDLVTWLKRYAVQQVFVTPRIAGCPHEEGIDYPEGQPCPQCPFWANRVRFIDELGSENASSELDVSDPEATSLVYSAHCQHYVHEGVTLDVQIYRGPSFFGRCRTRGSRRLAMTERRLNDRARGGAGKWVVTMPVGPVHPGTAELIVEYLEHAGHGEDPGVGLFRSLRENVRSGNVRCGRRPRPMRLITRPTLPRSKNGWGMRT